MISFFKKWNFKDHWSFTERAGIYYAAVLAEKQYCGNRSIIIFPTGYGFDMVIVSNTFNMDLQSIKQNGERFVEVKGDKRQTPNNFHICNTLRNLDKDIIEKLYVYLVYNVALNRCAKVAVFEPHYLNNMATYSQHELTFDIHGVGRDVRNGRVKSYTDIFRPLTRNQRNMINRSFRKGHLSSIVECNLKGTGFQSYSKMVDSDLGESNQRVLNLALTSSRERIMAKSLNHHKGEQSLSSIRDENRVSFLRKYLLPYIEEVLTGDIVSYRKKRPHDNYFPFKIISFFDYLSNTYSQVTIDPRENKILFDHKSYVYNTLWNDIINVLLSMGFIKSDKKGIYIFKLS